MTPARLHRLQLEEALCEGCLTGALPMALAEDAEIMRRCTHMKIEDDAGQSLTVSKGGDTHSIPRRDGF